MYRVIFIVVFFALGLAALAIHDDIAGAWRGMYEAPTGLGAIELTFSHEGTEWKAVCKFPEIDGENTFPARDLKVSDAEVSFVVAIESLQMNFNGKPAGDKLAGTYEMFRGGKNAYTGVWSVKRTKQPLGGVAVRAVQPDNSTGRRQQSGQTESKSVADLPAPTGPFAVGRTTFYWKDSARPESLTADPSDKRELMVTLWYPAQKEKGLSPAVYFPHYELLSGQSGAPFPGPRKVHAFEKAPLARIRRGFPVVLFSHGLGENTVRYSALLEELASYGYMVAAVDHTYDNQGVVFPDGRVARYSDRWEWAFSGDGIDQERFIRARLQVMAEDVSFVADQLNTLNGEPSGMFKGKLDSGNIGFFGHSLGGAIAPLVCQKDKRFKACLNQDGLLLGEVMILDPAGGTFERPFMFLAHSDPVTEETLQLMALTRTEYEEHDRTWRRRAYHALDMMPVESYIISINGAEHSSFTDNPLLEANTLSVYRNRARTLQVIRDYTRAFFDKYLMAKNTKLLESPLTEYPEVKMDRFGASVRR